MRTYFLIIFTNSLTREFKVLANIENIYFQIAFVVNLILARTNSLEIKNLRNKDQAKISECTV